MARALLFFSMLALLLTACSGADPRSLACARQSHDGQRWGYYPGYGCGPVPRAQTIYP